MLLATPLFLLSARSSFPKSAVSLAWTEAEGPTAVCANLISCNVEGVLPNCQDGILQCICDVLGCNVFDAIILPDGWNWGAIIGSQVGLDPTNDGSSCPDWAQRYVP